MNKTLVHTPLFAIRNKAIAAATTAKLLIFIQR